MDIVPQLVVNSLITGSIYALASVGLALSYGLLRILNFAHGHLMMVGAYLFYLTRVSWGLDMVPAVALTLVFAAILALCSLWIFIWPFLGLNTLLPFVTTLALSVILESLVAVFFGVNVRSLSTSYGFDSYQFWSVSITPVQIIIILSALVILIAAAWIVHATALGRAIRALAEFSPGAESLGINSRRVSSAVFLAAVLLAAYAGVMVGYETTIQPTMGGSYTIKAFAAMILGGLGNMWGTVIGSFILGFVENFSIGLDIGGYSIPAGYKDAFAFVIILLVLLFRPQGLLNTPTRRT